MSDKLSVMSQQEMAAQNKEQRTTQIRRLVRKFIKARAKDDMSRMREAGFHLIPLFKSHEIEDIRSLFREIEKEVGYK